ncbi:alpha/beta-hydrolase [Mollisia scopiformis]|uniref:Alpha/beta-hydrolase n=1 Tax=Mollisia scopiformis TaxID=149040 RepID=A0A194WS58_MOLSC|nr:alpha/beta-hydrolase [Mollisia scopiformis]KUJ10806.1 alpha/beta-hydrolase [Mollisia scopiformis]
MAAKSTHVFKTIGTLSLHLDIYTRTLPPANDVFTPETPVILFFHGGGVVSHDRRLLLPHIVQSSLLRGWPLVSADYRLLPQTKGIDILEDIKDAYTFVRTKLFSILHGSSDSNENVIKNVIVAGCSAGAYATYQAGHHFQPRPIALLAYYGNATVDDPWFRSNKVLTEKPLLQSQIQHFLDEPENCGYTTPAHQFDRSCLLQDLNPSPDWKKPEEAVEDKERLPRDTLYFWLLQNNLYPELMKGFDKSLSDEEAWKGYTRTVIVHGDEDDMVPYQASVDVASVIGPVTVKLFTVKGKKHAFDSGLYLGDPDLELVEEAWRALDEIVRELSVYTEG